MSQKPEISRMADLPVVPITIGDMSFNRTGLWRYLMPVVKDRTAPCQAACPLGMPSPDFINDLIQRDASAALGRIMELNPLPGITGRLCYHPCQAKCLRKELDQAVQIQKLEQYAADAAGDPLAPPDAGGQVKAAVLGAGPLGLSAAYFLGRAGVEVTLYDPLEQAGGFLSALDPSKLPEEVLNRETARLGRAAGINYVLGADFAALQPSEIGHGLDIALYDRTAHAAKSAPADSLDRLCVQLKTNKPLLDSAALCPGGAYKASQAALAIAAGRDLALQAMQTLGMHKEYSILKGLTEAGRTENAISAEDIRYKLFTKEPSAIGASKGQSITGPQALAEAERCLSCGHCNLCGRCLVFCPDVSLSVDEAEQRPQVDLMHCKGCGICAHECPRRAIVMER